MKISPIHSNKLIQKDNHLMILKFCRVFGLCPLNFNVMKPSALWVLYSMFLVSLLFAITVTGVWIEVINGKFNKNAGLVTIAQELLIISSELVRLACAICGAKNLCIIVKNFNKCGSNTLSSRCAKLQIIGIFVLITLRCSVSHLMMDYNVWLQAVFCLDDFFKLCGTLQIYNLIFALKCKLLSVNKKLEEVRNYTFKNK